MNNKEKTGCSAKPTPGPWVARCMGSEGYFVWMDRPISKEHHSLSPVASCAAMPFEISKANARLIAAAPELLEALEGILENLWQGRKRDVKRDYSLMVYEVAAQNAIRKARGE